MTHDDGPVRRYLASQCAGVSEIDSFGVARISTGTWFFALPAPVAAMARAALLRGCVSVTADDDVFVLRHARITSRPTAWFDSRGTRLLVRDRRDHGAVVSVRLELPVLGDCWLHYGRRAAGAHVADMLCALESRDSRGDVDGSGRGGRAAIHDEGAGDR